MQMNKKLNKSLNMQIQKSLSELSVNTVSDTAMLELLREHETDIKVGQIFISHNSSYSTVIKIYKIEEFDIIDYDKWHAAGKPEDKTKFAIGVDYRIFYCDLRNGNSSSDKNDIGPLPNTYWSSSYGNSNLKKFLDEYADYIVPNNNLLAVVEAAKKIISGESKIEDYKSDIAVNDQGLMFTGSSEHLRAMTSDLNAKRKLAGVVAAAVNREMVLMKQKLDNIRRELTAVVDDFKEKVTKIEKVIHTIELYIGLREDIVQIQTGEAAHADTPITFRQEVLCMDEEVGNPEDDGLDFNSIEVFDKWLTEYSPYYKKYNYELITPEEKCIIALKVRRNSKEYTDNPFVNRMLNIENHKTYILCRNGSNLYRIWGDLNIWPRLFPQKSELQELKDRWDEIDSAVKDGDIQRLKKEGQTTVWERDVTEQKERIEDKAFKYKQQMLLLQGLIDRTEIFLPMSGTVKLMDPNIFENRMANFIYDDDLLLSDGKKEFTEWLKDINSTVTIGSRIFWNVAADIKQTDYLEERFSELYSRGTWYAGKQYYNLPELPKSGLYTVRAYKKRVYKQYGSETAHTADQLPEYIKAKHDDISKIQFPLTYRILDEKGRPGKEYTEDQAAIYYIPSDKEQWHRYSFDDEKSSKKVNRVSFKIYLDTDQNYINFDALTVEELDFWLFDRRNRRHYLSMMPILWGLRNKLIEDRKWESHFIRMLIDDMKRNNQKISDPKESIMKAIKWWKTKNKWRRPLSEDDTKALRMIKKKLKL